MKKIKSLIWAQLLAIFILSGALVLPVPTEAETVLRSGDMISIGQDQLIEGDLYTAANIINISGQVEEDLLAAGAEVNINGQIGEDVLIIGGDVDIHGTVGDDLRVLGGTVILAEPVLGDVFVIGGTVQVLPTASITGDLAVIGGSVDIAGPVEGRVLGWVETLRIDSDVHGDVDVTAAELTLGDKANIAGNVKYVSHTQLVRSQSATVGGDVVRNDPVVEETYDSPLSVALPLLVLIFSVALWYLLSRRLLQRVVNRALIPQIRISLIGGLGFILAPFAISILLVSMLGSLVGMIMLALYFLFAVAAIIAMPAVLGQFVFIVSKNETSPVSLLTLMVGVLLVGLCLFVPILGPIIIIGFFVLTFGALVDLLLRANR